MENNLTRRGFMAVVVAGVVAPKMPVFKFRGPGLSAAIAEGINPEWDGTFRVYGNQPREWWPTRIMQDGKIADRFLS